MTTAEQFPAFTDANGTTWYRTGLSGSWTALPEYADPSYNTDSIGYTQEVDTSQKETP